MINVTFNPKKYQISISGHAGYNMEGNDVVCAAASMLFYTLQRSLQAVKAGMIKPKTLRIKEEPGNSTIKCTPLPQFEANVQVIFFTVLNGFEALMESFPENVKLTIL